MPHVLNRREASESPRPNVRLGKYRFLSALSEIKFLFCENLSTRASESANTGVVPSEISESGIVVLYRGILMFFIISFYRNCNVFIFRNSMPILETSRGGSCHITTKRSRTRDPRCQVAGEGGECRPPGTLSYTSYDPPAEFFSFYFFLLAK